MIKIRVVLTWVSLIGLFFIISGQAPAAGPHWVLNKKKLPSAWKEKIAIKQVNPIVIAFESKVGEPQYELRCSQLTGTGVITEQEPGVDSLSKLQFPMSTKTCSATSATERANKEENCLVKSYAEIGGPIASTLKEEGGKLFDEFTLAEFEAKIENSGMKKCPAALTGNRVIKAKKLSSQFVADGSKFFFAKVEELKFGEKAAFIEGEYVLETPTGKPVRVIELAGKAEWEVNEEPLEVSEVSGLVNEVGKMEIVDGSLGLTVRCETGQTEGVIERASGAAGSGTEAIELKGCKVVSPAICAIAETLTINAKTRLTSAGSGAFGDEFEALTEGGSLGTITITGGCPCSLAGTYELTGDAVGKINNEGEDIEFTNPAQSGSNLKLRATSAILVGDIKLKSGGAVAVES